ncbi:MAG: NAD(+) diphosphatase [Muribaculaceae bacterium]
MRFKYCPDCGSLLTTRALGDEGEVPWCENCDKPWFDMFPCCVISLVYSAKGHVLLLHQNYISPVYMNLVSGYITPGETAETAAVREINEETGLEVSALRHAGTWWFGKKQMLMIGFFAEADDSARLRLSSEVDAAKWVDAAKAPELVHPAGSVSHSLVDLFLESRKNTANQEV